MPIRPPNVDSVIDSVSTCDMMSLRLAPSALRRPISRPLADHHQHDVHDHDAADDQRGRDDADEDRKDAAGHLAIEVEDRVRCQDAEVVRRRRLEPPRHAQRDGASSMASVMRSVETGLTISDSDWRAPNSR